MQIIQDAINLEGLTRFKKEERQRLELRDGFLNAALRTKAAALPDQADKRNSRQKRRDKALAGAK